MIKTRLFVLALAGSSLAPVQHSPAATISEDFSHEPTTHNWSIFGDTNLFVWDASNQVLQVTWDSSQTNSYFYRPLGTILSKSDDFGFAFDLRLSDIRTNLK